MLLKFVIVGIIIKICLAAPQYVNVYPSVHPAVFRNAKMEAALPNGFRNDFYKNPLIAAGLARESLLTNKEMQVVIRQADDIPREKIGKLLHDAGFIR